MSSAARLPQAFGAFDGPGSDTSRARSETRAPPGSRVTSPTRSAGPESVDGGIRIPKELPRNLILPAQAYNLIKLYDEDFMSLARPGFNQSGTPVQVALNSHAVKAIPNKTIQQYDILIGDGTEKRGLIRAVWECKGLKDKIGAGGWLFDGNRIAWHMKSIGPMTFTIDMDVEKGRGQAPATNTRPGQIRDNKFTVQIRPTTKVNLAPLEAYLAGKISFDNSVLQAINFLDHLMRHTPAQKLINIKRSYFDRELRGKTYLGGGIEAIKGVYQSIRMGQGNKMIVNVDVANTCFFSDKMANDVALELSGQSDRHQIIHAIQRESGRGDGLYRDTKTMKMLRFMKKLSFTVHYRGVSEKVSKKKWIVKDISYSNARNMRFDAKDRKTGAVKNMSVADYFRDQYGHPLKEADLPLIETTKKGVFYPMEVCKFDSGQRYPFKLNERQTADMIKFAVTRPKDRLEDINKGLKLLDWQGDEYLKRYGLNVSPDQIVTTARLLSNPRVQFGRGKFEDPRTNGRWRIDGKEFYSPNKTPLKNWGICVVQEMKGRNAVTRTEAWNFGKELIRLYKSYGGQNLSTDPVICEHGDVEQGAHATELLYNSIMKKCSPGERPDLMLFILPRKETAMYNRMKKSCDKRWGVVSQMVQGAHVKRCQAQYIGNVLMKINAKLGGQSFKAMPIKGPVAQAKGNYFARPTIIIGADVSHAAPGSLMSSMAAITVSMDRDAIRYAATCQSNGHRVEMISTWNWLEMLPPMLREWSSTVGKGMYPQHLIYFRDGVSEGQYQHVYHQEVRDIKHCFKEHDNSNDKSAFANLKITVIIASKRHHIRFFPKPGPASDKSGNPCPGVLVERDVTHPFEYDFYLNAHTAIQGTSRPVHYHVIMDTAKMDPTFLQNMIYEHSYQYIRSSTSVSLHPAVYYAHLASKRAVAHERTAEGFTGHKPSEERERKQLIDAKAQCDQTGKIMTASAMEKLKRYTRTEYPILIEFRYEPIKYSMWYI